MMTHFPEKARVVFIGDSITAGANYVTRVASYYTRQMHSLGVTFKGAGISGGSCNSALLYYDTYVAAFHPTHGVIMLGVNDSGRDALQIEEEAERQKRLDASFEAYKTRLDTLLARLEADGVAVTLCTPAPYAEFQQTEQAPLPGGHALIRRYAEYVRRLARERGLPLVDFHARLSELYLDEVLYNPDHVHPNDRGQWRMAECFLDAQGLDVGEYRSLEELSASEPLLGEWNCLSGKIAGLYAVEWMVIQNFTLPTEEKLALVQRTIEEDKWAEQPYFRNITAMFMDNKPQEARMLARMDEIWKEIYPC